MNIVNPYLNYIIGAYGLSLGALFIFFIMTSIQLKRSKKLVQLILKKNS